jgi:hypothetical protein
MKMGRRPRCSSVTYRFRYAPLVPVRLGPPCRRPILIKTKYLVFRGQDTRFRFTKNSLEFGARAEHPKKGKSYEKGSSATTAEKRWDRAAGSLHRRLEHCAARCQNRQEVSPNGSLGGFERRFSRFRNSRHRVTVARRKRHQSDHSFPGRTRRSRRLHLLFLLFIAGDISQAQGSFHLDAALAVSVSAGEMTARAVHARPLVPLYSARPRRLFSVPNSVSRGEMTPRTVHARPPT